MINKNLDKGQDRVQETQQYRKITLDVDHVKAFEHETQPNWLNEFKCDVLVQTNLIFCNYYIYRRH